MKLKRDLPVAVGIAVLTFIIFAQAGGFDFINLDDGQYVTHNDRVLRGLSVDNVRWAFTTIKAANWHPLAWLSHMLDVQMFGIAPAGHHFTSVVLHCLNAALLYLVLVSMTNQPWRCGIVAAIFAIHPLRMESVAWISERKDLLCATFFLLAVGAYARYVKSGGMGWYAALGGLFALGILAKPMIVTLPCVLLLLDYWPLKRPVRFKKLVVEKLPLVALAGASGLITFIAQSRGGAMGTEQHIPLFVRIGNAVWSYGRYIRKNFFPNDLAAFYPYYGAVRDTSLPWLKVALAGACLVAITLIAIWFGRRQGERAVLVGWLWFLGTLVPVIGIVQVGMQSMADRYSYIPQIGLLIAIVWGIAAPVQRRPALRLTAQTVACVFAAALAITTAYQLRYWRNSYTLFERALQVTHDNAMANMCIALWLTTHQAGDESIRYYEEALRINPNMAEAHNNLGNLLRNRRDLHRALWHLARAGNLNPKYAEARNNLGNVLADLGRTDEALRQYEAAIRLDPDAAEAYFNYGVTLAAAGRIDQAITSFEHALRLRPRYPNARYFYALALVSAGRVEEGKRQFERVLESRPDWTEAMERFALALATSPNEHSRDPKAAVSLAEHANRLTMFDQPQLLDVLAAAYASAGKFDAAVTTAKRAHDLAAARGLADLAGYIADHLALYQTGRPYVASTQPATRPATLPTTR